MACQYKSRVWYNGWCNVACYYCNAQQESTCEHNKQTNADRIRDMSDEELSVFLWEFDKEEIARTTEYSLERRKITEWLNSLWNKKL